MTTGILEKELRERAELLVKQAAMVGLVITMEQKPIKPFAMGRYETIVTIRPARGNY